MTKKEKARVAFQQALRDGRDPDTVLWEALITCQGECFHTMKGLEYSYTIRTRHDGALSGELFITRKEKSITQSTVFMAFHKARELGGVVAGPKILGTFGASYLYPIFIDLGIIHPEKQGQLSLFDEDS